MVLVSNRLGDWPKVEYYEARDRKAKDDGFVLLPVIIADRAKGPAANLPGAYLAPEQAAKADRAGLWSGTFVPPWDWRYGARATSARPSLQQSGPGGCNIKGNVNRRGERIYPVPGSEDYRKVVINTAKGERWFCSEAEAVQAGWRRRR